MPKTALGIKLSPKEALVVHLKGGWKTATVGQVFRIPLPEGSPEERGGALLGAGLPQADAVIAGLPADAAFPRIVELPFSDRARVLQAAPLEAEETLPLPLEEVLCDAHVLERSGGGSRSLLAAAPTKRVEALLDELTAGGLPPQTLDVEALALAAIVRPSLPAGGKAAVLDLAGGLCQGVLVDESGPWSFHAFSATSGDANLISEAAALLARWREAWFDPELVYLSGSDARSQDRAEWAAALGRPVEILPFPTNGVVDASGESSSWPDWAIPLGLSLREAFSRQGSQINLLQGPFAPAHSTGPWKRLAVMGGVYLGILLALWGVSVWTESAYRNAQYDALRTEIRSAFQEALPRVQNIVSEVDQMRTAVRDLEGRAQSLGSLVDREVSPLSILREISTRIPKELEVEFRDFTVEEGRVRIEGVTTSFDAIDKIKADLSQYPRFSSVTVSDAKAGVERDKVLFKLTINMGREG
jgi:general secretion pathway protein L